MSGALLSEKAQSLQKKVASLKQDTPVDSLWWSNER